MTRDARLRVLTLARNYPNPVLPTLGIWTERLTQSILPYAEPRVIAPVPWAPPGVPIEAFRRFRSVPSTRRAHDIDINHPRVLTGPGYLLHRFDAALWYPAIRRVADRLHRERAFDLIHAHFVYPDGVIAARLGRRFGIPVVVTEQAPWMPWLGNYPAVARQVRNALPAVSLILPVSASLERNVRSALPDQDLRSRVVNNLVDERVFVAPAPTESRDADRLLFVGVVRHVKGLDVLVRALALLAPNHPAMRLLVVGSAYYRAYARDEAQVRALIRELGLDARVDFAGHASPDEVARYMRTSAMLVVPSRRETFSAVTAEALASGTPVVATRCGGPEEVLTNGLGKLVPVEDPQALAAGIAEVHQTLPQYDPATLRASVLSRFGMHAVGDRLQQVYHEVLKR